MSLKRTKGRFLFYLIFAIFFLLGGPALASEEPQQSPEAPSAILSPKHFVYNGDVQYVTLDSLSHPLEAQGHYSFAWYKNGELLPCAAHSLPVRTVSDSGIYFCRVTFTYNGVSVETTTDSVEVRVDKKEAGVPSLSPLVYTGYHQYPQVYESAEYSIKENAGAVAVGSYTVVLELKDLENLIFPTVSGAQISEDGARLSLPYTVEKAENLFSTPLAVPTCYEGSAPRPQAFAKFGDVRFVYFSDAEGRAEIAPPSRAGVYYVQAISDTDPNVHPIYSSLVRFEIQRLTVSALRMLAPPSCLSYTAFETVSLEGLSLVATMADGSVRPVPTEALLVSYPIGGNCFFAKDTYVLLSYEGVSLPISVSVSRASLDFSSVVWSSDGWIYDGVERELRVSGLPAEVSISSYQNHRITDAGTYTVFAFLSFDRENYEGPQSLTCTVSVEKQSVMHPTLPADIYNGSLLIPNPPPSSLYVFENFSGVVHAGIYSVPLRLTDPKNYRFEGTEEPIILVPFEILPIPLRVAIDDVVLYIGDRFVLPRFRILSGEPLEGDDLGFGVTETNGTYHYYFENPNYSVTYEGGRVERIYRLPRGVESAVFLGLTALILLVLGIFGMILLYRRRVRPITDGGAISSSSCTYPLFTKRDAPPLMPRDTEYRLSEKTPPEVSPSVPCISEKEAEKTEDTNTDAKENEAENLCVDAVDVSTADALITDALAEALVMAEERIIYTEGTRHGVINVDTLSAAFAPGEEVDINRLKKKKLIARDVGYLKVLARGSIDKPLTVYADDFSLGAIKMIALTGGRTFHVKSRPMP